MRIFLASLALILVALVLLPFQLAGLWLGHRMQRDVPMLFHRAACAIMGIRITQIGERSRSGPLLILSNHASWLDIVILGAIAPVVFVSKSDVANWPLFGWLAKLQRTIFVERERRHKTGDTTRAMGDRLLGGDAVVLFPEGTSSDGIRILPFRSALIGAVHQAIGGSAHHERVVVQPVSLAYTRYGGVPVGRALRDKVAWYGETELVPHLLGVLSCGAIDITVSWGEAVSYGMNADRKQIARDAEASVRRMTARALRAPVAQPTTDDAMPSGIPVEQT